MEDYQEIILEKYREVVVFSFFYISFLSGELFFTKELCGFIRVAQQKVKYRETWFDEWDYQIKWCKFNYKWVKI